MRNFALLQFCFCWLYLRFCWCHLWVKWCLMFILTRCCVTSSNDEEFCPSSVLSLLVVFAFLLMSYVSEMIPYMFILTRYWASSSTKDEEFWPSSVLFPLVKFTYLLCEWRPIVLETPSDIESHIYSLFCSTNDKESCSSSVLFLWAVFTLPLWCVRGAIAFISLLFVLRYALIAVGSEWF